MTTQDQLFSGLMDIDSESLQKILLAMLNEEKNLSMKTEIQNPLAMTRLDILAFWIESEGMKDSAEITKQFIRRFQIYMVSHKRQSRTEVIQALTEGFKREREITEKLASKEGQK